MNLALKLHVTKVHKFATEQIIKVCSDQGLSRYDPPRILKVRSIRFSSFSSGIMHLFKAGLPVLAVCSVIQAIPVNTGEGRDTALHRHDGLKASDTRQENRSAGGFVPPHILRNITRSPFATDDERRTANRTLVIDGERWGPQQPTD
ncbi:hypothetical protein CPAR01_09977 [Colletotrichum paranaense]|uniref:Uncharacterized protein n=1 Tax=Colletotrichum paranaense TaxID=1914294 RepID=A0ABQ9SCV0_9PEZI|nr:uncharacterized protein CPAR01_09977 [Colletotrichum paranaense]KAK1533269.1 hypothetical protein CPAR01_09977 [Colletotrichum paranaense]